jgi:hypothetical protein
MNKIIESKQTPIELNPDLAKNQKFWGRFIKVRQIIANSLLSDPTPGLIKNFDSFSWSGVDTGIHDHKGSMRGIINDIKINVSLKGTTVDNQPEYEKDSNGNWKINTHKETKAFIAGNFVSADGYEGAIEIVFKNGKSYYEAYWLFCIDGYLRLEQVIDPNGNVFDAKELKLDNQGKAKIPDTDQSVDTQKPKQVLNEK